MKKFITTKINKPQWRITMPNINLRKSPTEDEDRSSKRSSSGFYDFMEAQQEFDQSRSLPNSVYIESASTTSTEEFEDASTVFDRGNRGSDTDQEAFQDVETNVATSKNIDQNNSQYEYDVPRISFKFFGEDKDKDENIYENETGSKSEVQIVLTTPKDEQNISLNTSTANANAEEYDVLPPSHPSEKFVSHTEVYVRSLDNIPLTVLKSAGSDPSVAIRSLSDDESNFYQIPRPLKVTKRQSQSLTEFNLERNEIIANFVDSDNSSIEHISASQVLNNGKAEISGNTSTPAKRRLKLRKPSILRKEKWDSFKERFNNMMQEQASKQRVGAFNDKDKITINLEEMYKNSKSKCKKVFENTSKMFHKKKQESSDVIFESVVKKVTATDIEYKLNYTINEDNCVHNISNSSSVNNNSININRSISINSGQSVKGIGNTNEEIDGSERNENREDSIEIKVSSDNMLNNSVLSNESKVSHDEKKDEFDFAAIKNAFRKKLLSYEGQNGFEDLRRYVKQGSDFCKELAQILQERAEAEAQYAKNLSKLSTKLSRACRDNVGGLNEAWKAVALELETKAEAHRLLGVALLEETAKPLRAITENQHRIRKQSETQVDKAAKQLAEWRTSEAKGKKTSHACSRENEKLQDAAVLDSTTKYNKQTISKSTSLIQLAHMRQHSSDKDNTKLEGKKRKAEDAVRKADVEYYTLCVRAERARLEWESAVLRGASTFQALEEERLNNLKAVLFSYLNHNTYIGPRLIEATERLKIPVSHADPVKDLSTFQSLRQSSQQISEQLLPDFYCEHITLAMNRERRKQALIKLLQLVRLDMERERKSKIGLENLSKAIKQNPSFGSEDSQQTVIEKLYHMKSMMTYLEGAKYKISNALAEIDNRPKTNHFLASHITITRDKSGLQQSILKVPQWLKDEWCETDRSPVSQKSMKSNQSDNSDPHNNDVDDPEWLDRGAADGNSNQPDSDFDEFSSQCSSAGDNVCPTDDTPIHPIATCRAIYAYTPNMHDELHMKAGDVITVYRQQDDGWWLGECNGNVGIFPATYVELIQDC